MKVREIEIDVEDLKGIIRYLEKICQAIDNRTVGIDSFLGTKDRTEHEREKARIMTLVAAVSSIDQAVDAYRIRGVKYSTRRR
jgi:hypothetical protein